MSPRLPNVATSTSGRKGSPPQGVGALRSIQGDWGTPLLRPDPANPLLIKLAR